MVQADATRALFVQNALALVGLGANPNNPEARQNFLDLVAPGETAARQMEMGQMSSCALVVAGIWRKSGLVHALLEAPYRTGTAVSRLGQIAPNAWVAYRAGTFPQPGDVVRIGDNSPENGVEHVYTVTELVGKPPTILKSVDGGQRDSEGFQVIHDRRRAWRRGRDLVFAQATQQTSTVSRKIFGWFDAEKLATLIPDGSAVQGSDPCA